jgi:transcription-repair coupling factor (superfamily II helicase)
VPSLKLQELLRAARVRAAFAPEAKGAGVRVDGLTPAAKAFWIAGAASDDPRNELVLAVVPTDRDVEQMVGDVRFFLGGLEGSSADELEHAVLPFPSQEVDPYRGLAPHLRIASARARALHAMAASHARVVVASASALVPRVSPPDALEALALDLKPGDEVDTQRLAETLVDAGFTRQDPVDEHGQFCIRGGVVDIFPAGDDLPARLELIGDTVEAIRRYAPDTQRSVSTADRLRVVPLRDAAGEGGPRVPFFEYLGIARRPVLVASEPDEIRERVEKHLAQVSESYEYARNARAAGITGRRTSSRAEGGFASRTEAAYTSRVETASPDTAIDGVPEPAAILIGWPDIERQLAGADVLEELGIGDPGSKDPGLHGHDPGLHAHAPASQPALSFAGRLADWINEVKAARARGDVVVFVAATPGRAERLIEVLDDYELRGVNVDRGEDSFAASVLVTTGVLSRGFRLPGAQLQIYAETDLFEEERRIQDRARR